MLCSWKAHVTSLLHALFVCFCENLLPLRGK
nr:MAG TPA: hypothetical protein [Bacteriophage sp.]